MNHTFSNLSEKKRQNFIQVALKEFAQNNYELASINRIIKEIGIARGSVYQYFKDKLDLWLFLKKYAENKKIEHIKAIHREDYDDFWSYYKELYLQGAYFALEEPNCSKLLNRIAFLENSKEVLSYVGNWEKEAGTMLTQMVEHEKSLGFISNSIKTELVVAFLISVGRSINLIINKYGDISDMAQGQIDSNSFTLKEEYLELVEDYIDLVKKALI